MTEKKVRPKELTAGIILATGDIYTLRLPSVVIFLDIDPNEQSSRDDKYTLYSTDEAKSYKKTLTIKDDLVPGDKYTELCFACIDEEKNYTLEIDPGKDGEVYNLFEDISFEEIDK